MEVNEAKKIVEKEFPTVKAAYAVPFNGKIVFEVVDKKTRSPVLVNGLIAVDENGEISSFSPTFCDVSGFSEVKKKDAVYFSKEGMDMANLEPL